METKSEFCPKGKPNFTVEVPDYLERLSEQNYSEFDKEKQIKLAIQILKHLLMNHNANIVVKLEVHYRED